MKHDLDSAIRDAAYVRGGPLATDDAKRELIANVLAEPRDAVAPTPSLEPSSRSHPVSLLGRRPIAFAVPAILATVVIALSLVLGTSPSGSPATALASAIERLVRTSPHILADAPGWRMQAAIQASAGRGEIRFFRSGGQPTTYLSGRISLTETERAELEWRSGSASAGRAPELGRDYVFEGMAPVLDTGARVFRHLFRPGAGARRRSVQHPSRIFFAEQDEYVAIWEQTGQTLAFRSFAPDRPTFERRLASLVLVTRARWLAALPGHRVRHRQFAVAETPLAEGVLRTHCTAPVSPSDVPAAERPQARAYNYICTNPALSTGFLDKTAKPATTDRERK